MAANIVCVAWDLHGPPNDMTPTRYAPPLRIMASALPGHRIRIRGHNDGPLPSVRCTPSPTSEDHPFDVRQVRDLAGDYDIILVYTTSRSSGATEHRGRLRLWVQDSVRSHRFFNGKLVLGPGFERPLAGSFVAAPPDTGAYWRRMASTTLNHPGGVWMGDHLSLGYYDMMDGPGEDLRVTHAGPSGFRGQWHRDFGIAVLIDTVTHQQVPNPGGYFCAYRRIRRRSGTPGTLRCPQVTRQLNTPAN